MQGRPDVDKIMREIGPHLQSDTAGDAQHYNRVYELVMRILDKYEGTRLTWYPFEADRSRQYLPPEKKYVLVRVRLHDKEQDISIGNAMGLHVTRPDVLAVGYLKYAAGDRECPQFIVPGAASFGTVVGWCDCLPESFLWPKED